MYTVISFPADPSTSRRLAATEKQRRRQAEMEDARFSISCTESCLRAALSYIEKDDPCIVRLNILDAIKNLSRTEKRLKALYYRRKKA